VNAVVGMSVEFGCRSAFECSRIVMRVCVRVLLKLMQAEVEQLQEKVNGLHSMVVVVDDNNAESGNIIAADVFPIIACIVVNC